jgi:tungstate transport system substrate-binding protein
MSDRGRPGLNRRAFLSVTAASALAAPLLGGCSRRHVDPASSDAAPPAPYAPVDAKVVRVMSVPTAVDGALLPTLVTDFERESGLTVELLSSTDLYSLARKGQVDVAISHYGHRDAEQFVMDGYGEWPRTLFSNQMALLGPKADPAKVRGITDAAEAFRRIAAAKAPFVLNDLDGVRYLTEILWHAAGRPERGAWFLDDHTHRKEDAVLFAASKNAYVFWGLTPFLRFHDTPNLGLEPLVLADPLLQRLLVSILVKPSRVPGVNHDGARALEAYLLTPATQARIRDVHYPGIAGCTWTPAGRHNPSEVLPKG